MVCVLQLTWAANGNTLLFRTVSFYYSLSVASPETQRVLCENRPAVFRFPRLPMFYRCFSFM